MLFLCVTGQLRDKAILFEVRSASTKLQPAELLTIQCNIQYTTKPATAIIDIVTQAVPLPPFIHRTLVSSRARNWSISNINVI